MNKVRTYILIDQSQSLSNTTIGILQSTLLNQSIGLNIIKKPFQLFNYLLSNHYLIKIWFKISKFVSRELCTKRI